ncbi:hypothetical protein TNIN_121991 [Trichonephila inaurata madagascariensis]|uniref:Uncharacterized protein n=1 Tax=Trichonephila inaurata madagascariensis TaxID=2747483 RepID=A0A8X6WSI4_9ARAC|nr:hypothetical protein TNIN_121991 [Trichonephila inaurata madagascariensis]
MGHVVWAWKEEGCESGTVWRSLWQIGSDSSLSFQPMDGILYALFRIVTIPHYSEMRINIPNVDHPKNGPFLLRLSRSGMRGGMLACSREKYDKANDSALKVELPFSMKLMRQSAFTLGNPTGSRSSLYVLNATD